MSTAAIFLAVFVLLSLTERKLRQLAEKNPNDRAFLLLIYLALLAGAVVVLAKALELLK